MNICILLRNRRRFLEHTKKPSKIDFKPCILLGGINRLQRY